MVMSLPAMVEGVRTNDQGKQNHKHFERNIVYNIYTEQRKRRKKQWQQRTMYSTGK